MLPADWEEYVAGLEREIASRPSTAPKRTRTTGRVVSRRQRIALSQTNNTIKASYSIESVYNRTPLADDKAEFTTELGGTCEQLNQSHGHSTR
jgi:hypothetical protein